MLLKNFGVRLRKLRSDRGLTQRQLADLVGCETMLISRYERGAGLPKLDTLVGLAEALRISTDELALGRKPSEAGGETPIQNVLLLERFRELQALPREDQTTLVKVIDAVIKSRKAESVFVPARRSA